MTPPLPDVGQDEPWRADEVRAGRLPRGDGDDPDRGVGQRDPRLDRGPAKDGRACRGVSPKSRWLTTFVLRAGNTHA